MKQHSCLAALIVAWLAWPAPGTAAPIHEAAREGDVAKVRQLIEAGADINARKNQYEGTPLDIAVAQGHAAVVQLLLDKGAEANANPPKGMYNLDGLMLTAARGGHVDVLRILLKKAAAGGKVAQKQLNALLREAVQYYNGADAAKFLIEQGADVNDNGAPAAGGATGKPAAGAQPQEPSLLMLATGNNSFNLKMISVLIAHGAKTRPGEDGDKILIGWAAAEGKVDKLRKLLDEGIDANTCLEQGEVDCLVPLELAVRNNKLKAVALLLRHGATPTASQLSSAICSRNLALLKLLVTHSEAATDSDSDSDSTLLSRRMYDSYLANAVACGDKATLAYLMAKAPEINYENITQSLQYTLNPQDRYAQGEAVSGRPPDVTLFTTLYAGDAELKVHAAALLAPAIMGGHDKFAIFLFGKGASLSQEAADSALQASASDNQARSVELLLDHGAQSEVRSGLGNTPLLLAAPYGHTEAAAALLKRGANVNAKNVQYNTALHMAAARNLKPMAELLIRQGARVNAVNIDGYTPLHQAARFTAKFEVLRLLLENKAKPNIRSRSGMTPLHFLVIRNIAYDEYAYIPAADGNQERAMQSGFDGVHPDMMPLEEEERISAVKLLLSYGADPSIRNQNGDSAIELERKLGHNPELLRLLTSKDLKVAK